MPPFTVSTSNFTIHPPCRYNTSIFEFCGIQQRNIFRIRSFVKNIGGNEAEIFCYGFYFANVKDTGIINVLNVQVLYEVDNEQDVKIKTN